MSIRRPCRLARLGYSRQGKLVDTVYMIPLKDLVAHQKIAEMAAPAGAVDHVGVYFNPAHAGMAKPHYHIVLWHVPSPKGLRLRSNRIAPPAAMENPMAVTLL